MAPQLPRDLLLASEKLEMNYSLKVFTSSRVLKNIPDDYNMKQQQDVKKYVFNRTCSSNKP